MIWVKEERQHCGQALKYLFNLFVCLFGVSVLWLKGDELLHSTVWSFTGAWCFSFIGVVTCAGLPNRTPKEYDNRVNESSSWS